MNAWDIVLYEEITPYLKAVQEYLKRAEAENGLFLGGLNSLKEQPPPKQPFMAKMKSKGQTIGAAFFHEINLIISRGPNKVWKDVATQLRELNIDIPGVIGFAPSAQSMAEAGPS